MYYVPEQVWPTWSQVAGIVSQRFFVEHNILKNEVAVPLIIDVVAEHGVCKVGRCSTEVVTTCWGGPLDSTQDPALLQQYSCGHKMDLTSPQIREGLLALWGSSHDEMDPSSLHIHEVLLSLRRSSSTDPQRTVIPVSIYGALAIFAAIAAFVCVSWWLMPLLANHVVSVCFMTLYLVVSVTIDLVIMSQTNEDRHFEFNPLCTIILTELAKLVFSMAAHMAGPTQWFEGLRLSDACWMCLPATCYTLNNFMVFVAIAANGAATFGIFRDTVVIWTAASWYLVYKVPLKRIRIFGIMILLVGLLINRFSVASDAAASNWAFLSVVFMTLCNALGAVTNEFALKRNAELDINVQNMLLYTMCASTSICILALSNPIRLSSVHSFFEGFTRQTVLMIGLQASAGLLISRLLKYTDAVYKSVGSCLRGPLLVVIAPLFVYSETPSSAATLVSAFVVASGSFTYLSQGPLSACAEVKTDK